METVLFLINLKLRQNRPTMYCTQEMKKDLIIARFIVATKKCSTRVISTAVSKAFKLMFYQIQGFYINHISILHFNNFELLKNLSPLLKKLKRLIVKLMKSYFNCLRICSHLLNKSLMENFIFCSVFNIWLFHTSY